MHHDIVLQFLHLTYDYISEIQISVQSAHYTMFIDSLCFILDVLLTYKVKNNK